METIYSKVRDTENIELTGKRERVRDRDR